MTRAPGARGKDFASDSVRSGAVVGRGVDQGSATAGLSGFTPAATRLEGVPAKPRDPGLPQGLRALFLTPWSMEPTLPKRLRVESFANSMNSLGYSQAPPHTHTHHHPPRNLGGRGVCIYKAFPSDYFARGLRQRGFRPDLPPVVSPTP